MQCWIFFCRNIDTSSGVLIIKQIQEGVQTRLSELIPELCESENKVFQLEQEILEMQRRLHVKEEKTNDCHLSRNRSDLDMFHESDNDEVKSVVSSNNSFPEQDTVYVSY